MNIVPMLRSTRRRMLELRHLRLYATINSAQEPFYDDLWPKTSRPTPYEVLGLPAGQLDHKMLKKRYFAMAKLYHPDIAGNITILRTKKQHHFAELSDQSILSAIDKQRRFQMVSEAYELLRDSRKKSTYDRFRSGWTHGPIARTPAYAAAAGHGYQEHYRYQYWNAGTWEDANNLGKNDEKHISPWAVIAWMVGLFICAECTALLTRIEDSLTRVSFTHDETERDLTQAQINYGLDTDKWSRLRRFLWFRTYGLYRTKSDLDREAQKNEELVEKLKRKEE
ncbi:LAMI_0E09868g1_1 [Lachancea mirantina]|uniref:LAMI_0E09868g1_1 n=1 Tax=Lachancea mirantina TaxID=1230905 RepID=A0A1G4JNR4_9SACH|nr:LAMI_0E09868g1_1 [Lachancea mirantina]